MKYIYSVRGAPLLILDNYLYRKNREKYWRCYRFAKYHCTARLTISSSDYIRMAGVHNHAREYDTIRQRRKSLQNLGMLRKRSGAANLKNSCYRQIMTSTLIGNPTLHDNISCKELQIKQEPVDNDISNETP